MKNKKTLLFVFLLGVLIFSLGIIHATLQDQDNIYIEGQIATEIVANTPTLVDAVSITATPEPTSEPELTLTPTQKVESQVTPTIEAYPPPVEEITSTPVPSEEVIQATPTIEAYPPPVDEPTSYPAP